MTSTGGCSKKSIFWGALFWEEYTQVCKCLSTHLKLAPQTRADGGRGGERNKNAAVFTHFLTQKSTHLGIYKIVIFTLFLKKCTSSPKTDFLEQPPEFRNILHLPLHLLSTILLHFLPPPLLCGGHLWKLPSLKSRLN